MWRRESALLHSDVEDDHRARARRWRSMPPPPMPSSSVFAATLYRARGARASWRMSRHVASRAFLALTRFDSWNDASDAVEPSLRTRVCGMSCDKVFSCAWVDAHTVVFGTKCNRVFEVDVGRRRMSRADDDESMKTNDAAKEVFIQRGDESGSGGGTYATCVNATREIVLASGGDAHDVCLLRFQSDDSRAAGCETSSLASSLEPYCALRGHTDVVYGADFITRDIVATCARDGCVKIWRAPPPPLSGAAAPTSRGALETVYPFTSGPATRVRGVKYLDDLSCPTLATITKPHGHISRIDVETASCVDHYPMRGYIETSCVATNGSIIAAGSRTHIGLCDFRTSHLFDSVALPRRNTNSARSLSFIDRDMLVVGGGHGTIALFDIRTRRWLMTSVPMGHGLTRCAVEFELVHDAPCVPFDEERLTAALWADDDARSLMVPAIFCHAFDETFARLFVGGGPLHTSLFGSFAGVWS